MEILERGEVLTDDENPVFSHSIVVYRDSGTLMIGKTKSHVLGNVQIDFSAMQSSRICLQDIYPSHTEKFTEFIGHEDKEIFTKQPSLLDYTPDIGDYYNKSLILREAEVGELLKRNPHPNVARYMGCKVDDDRIIGLCWQNYRFSLRDKLEQLSSFSEVKLWMTGIVKGIGHIHSLGYCHNDINPSNIRFADDGTPVIIDFDSCQRTGKPLELKGGTIGWYDENASLSLPENDYFGIQALEEFLVSHID
ncbi:Protein kinase [Gracilaria domingensis]|nr:Protein kinase [Gracilaria domingensis]